jgi:hypothetical protein
MSGFGADTLRPANREFRDVRSLHATRCRRPVRPCCLGYTLDSAASLGVSANPLGFHNVDGPSPNQVARQGQCAIRHHRHIARLRPSTLDLGQEADAHSGCQLRLLAFEERQPRSALVTAVVHGHLKVIVLSATPETYIDPFREHTSCQGRLISGRVSTKLNPSLADIIDVETPVASVTPQHRQKIGSVGGGSEWYLNRSNRLIARGLLRRSAGRNR